MLPHPIVESAGARAPVDYILVAAPPPVVLAYGIGVDSTALLVELESRGEPPDLVLTADPGAEKPETYEYQRVISLWMAARGIPYEVVRYVPTRFKHWPPYYSILANVLTNATLPSISLGRHSCSLGLPIETGSFARDEGRADCRANPKSWRWSARPSRRAATLKRRMRRRTKMPRLLFKPFVSESISLAERWPPL